MIETLTDKELLENTKSLRGKEKELMHKLLLHFGEVDERKLYRDAGYPALFIYLHEGLKYSRAGAYRRQVASQAVRKHPELSIALKSGAISFSALVEIAKCATRENVAELTRECSSKSEREVKLVVERRLAPEVLVRKKEKVRAVKVKKEAPIPAKLELKSDIPQVKSSDSRSFSAELEIEYSVSLQVDEEFMKLYREAKAIAGGVSMKEVFTKVLKDYTQRNSPKEKMKRREKRASSRKPSHSATCPSKLQRRGKATRDKKASSNSRHIPIPVQDDVRVRDKNQCTYVSPDGVRCCSTEYLEIDHIKPFSLGGEHTPENLRLLCRAHNQLHAEQTLGKSFMEQCRAR